MLCLINACRHMMKGCSDGTFLIRVGDRSRNYAMSVMWGRMRHYKIIINAHGMLDLGLGLPSLPDCAVTVL